MFTETEVLHLLDPADPDSLTTFTPGIWTARWSKLGVPLLDKIVVETHDQLQIVRRWYEPPNLPGWTAIDFRVLA